jgi:hypothetical protein
MRAFFDLTFLRDLWLTYLLGKLPPPALQQPSKVYQQHAQASDKSTTLPGVHIASENYIGGSTDVRKMDIESTASSKPAKCYLTLDVQMLTETPSILSEILPEFNPQPSRHLSRICAPNLSLIQVLKLQYQLHVILLI